MTHRVVWTQGMFLQPHHFQQEARFVEQLVDARVRATQPHAWGYSELVLDDGLLALGQVGIARASGVLSDGSPFAMPLHDALPAPLDVPADLQGELVYLAAPLARPGVTEVDFGDGFDPAGTGDAGGRAMRRWRVQDASVRDQSNAADEPEPLQTGALALRLLRERDATDGYALLGVVRVQERRADRQVVLDRGYIAPQTRIDASGQLAASAALLHGLVQQRARLLAARMGQGATGVSELADFLMLQALNRAEPLLRQHAGAPSAHPAAFHRDCLQLAGDLATFASEQRVPADYPLYRHDDLHASFVQLVEDLRRMLSVVLDRKAQQLELVARSHGVRTAVIPDAETVRSAVFVLAVNAQLPAEQVRQRFPAQSKLGPVDRIRDLVNLQVPGIAVRSLPVAPRQLPFHAGFHYFELERQGGSSRELWAQLESNPSLALHVAGDFPGLELELWAIRA